MRISARTVVDIFISLRSHRIPVASVSVTAIPASSVVSPPRSPSLSLLTSRINSPTPLSLTPSSPSSSGPLLHRRRRRRCRRQGNRLPLNLPPVPVLPPSTPPQWSRCVRPLMTDGRSRRRLLVSTHQSPNVPSLALYTVESLARLSRLTEARARCLTMYLLT